MVIWRFVRRQNLWLLGAVVVVGGIVGGTIVSMLMVAYIIASWPAAELKVLNSTASDVRIQFDGSPPSRLPSHGTETITSDRGGEHSLEVASTSNSVKTVLKFEAHWVGTSYSVEIVDATASTDSN